MSYPLRLPPNLEAAARERAANIGISFNAFLCVCVDAYLNGAAKPAGKAGMQPRAQTQTEQRRAKRDEAEFRAVGRQAFGDEGEDGSEDDKSDWRFFHGDPHFWPHVDPDPEWSKRRDEIVEKYGDAYGTANRVLDREYWATRERPADAQPGSAPKPTENEGASSRKGRK